MQESLKNTKDCAQELQAALSRHKGIKDKDDSELLNC